MKYTGTLNRPVTEGRRGLINAPDYSDDWQRIYKEINAKLPELFKIHNVSEGDWEGLALALAVAHVPGFKIIERAGRKTKWDYFQKAEFRIFVDAIISESNKKMSVVEAIGHAQARDAWKDKTAGMKISALSKHYYGADLDSVELLKRRLTKKQLSKTNNS